MTPLHSSSPNSQPRRLMLIFCFLGAGAILWMPAATAQVDKASSSRQTPQSAGSPTGLASGKLVFNQRCAICHYPESAAQKIGPGLKGIFAHRQFANGKKVDDASVTRWIESGGKNMPGFKDALKPNQIRALLAYLKTL